MRRLRGEIGLSQEAFAAWLAVPVNTLRMWDSGLRPTPPPALHRARDMVARRVFESEPLGLDTLAHELGMHVRTLQAAARTGRLEVEFSSRSVFGRPMRTATRAAGLRFRAKHYRRFAGQAPCPAPLPSVPEDYDIRLKELRQRLGLSQHDLALKIGAAGKAVVYQWESRKRSPSPVFWEHIEALVVEWHKAPRP